MRYIFSILVWSISLLGLNHIALAQNDSMVVIHSTIVDQKNQAIIGASVSFPNSNITTITDAEGHFELTLPNVIQPCHIELSGNIDTTFKIIPSEFPMKLSLNTKVMNLESVMVIKRRKASEINMLSTTNQTKLGIKELAKAACCNLSESFETTPAVDVGFTDAVTGFRQISMLGLSGPNVSYTRENIPDLRGLGSITGLTFTPGPWVEAIMLSKGTGSVLNGYEGVAGQINVELSKPSDVNGFKYLINGYQSTQGRSELNLVKHNIFSNQANNSLFFHYKNNWMRVDQNNDSFLDQPMGQTLSLANRTMYISNKNMEYQLGLKAILMDMYGGENNYSRKQEISVNNPWGFKSDIGRGEVWVKIGKLYLHEPYRSQAIQLSGILQNQNSTYGVNKYDAKQKSFYANYIYQDIISNTNHKYKVGASFIYDDIMELWSNKAYSRREIVPGIYGEYTYNYLDKVNVVAGLRGDYNNYYGFFMTPRLHLRYAPNYQTTIRASIGRAQRVVNIFSENVGFMASNRTFEIISSDKYKDAPYGLAPEVAWNIGGSAIRNFILGYRDGSFSVDYYYTFFENMIVRDIEAFQKISFYNLDGKAYAQSFQAQIDYELLKRLDIRMAYRWYDVKTSFQSKGLLTNPLIANHRFFVNLAYETKNKWKADITANWTGSKRMVAAQHSSLPVVKDGFTTPSFWTLNGQISKSHKKELWRIYLGVENILNDMQHHLIMNPKQPFSTGFDAGLVWGNGMGRNIYLGFDIKLN